MIVLINIQWAKCSGVQRGPLRGVGPGLSCQNQKSQPFIQINREESRREAHVIKIQSLYPEAADPAIKTISDTEYYESHLTICNIRVIWFYISSLTSHERPIIK